MKDAQSLILHFKGIPHNQKLNEQARFEQIKKLLPPRLSNAVLFMYIKNKILFFALNHPGMQMEFNYNLQSIKSILSKARELDPTFPEINDAKCFVSHKVKHKFEEQKPSPSEPHYKEHAEGNFENFAHDEEIREQFEEIKKIICSLKN